jgi:hypothetical protein
LTSCDLYAHYRGNFVSSRRTGAALTEPGRKPPPARRSGARCAPRSLTAFAPCGAYFARERSRRAAPFSPALWPVRSSIRAWWFQRSVGVPTPPRASADCASPPRPQGPRGSPRCRSRASWSRNQPADQPLPGREHVVSGLPANPRDPGKGRVASPVMQPNPGGFEGRARSGKHADASTEGNARNGGRAERSRRTPGTRGAQRGARPERARAS